MQVAIEADVSRFEANAAVAEGDLGPYLLPIVIVLVVLVVLLAAGAFLDFASRPELGPRRQLFSRSVERWERHFDKF